MRQVASLSLNIRAEERSDGHLIYVSISTDAGAEWVGTEEQFRQMFSISGRDRKADVNALAVVVQSLWDKALARNVRSNNPGFLVQSFIHNITPRPTR